MFKTSRACKGLNCFEGWFLASFVYYEYCVHPCRVIIS